MIMKLVSVKEYEISKDKYDLVFHSINEGKGYISYLVYSTEIKHDIRENLTITELYNLYGE
jgi:hypothetical protein